MRKRLLASFVAIGLTGAAQAGPYLGGTLDVHVGDVYYKFITAQGGSFSASGLAQAVAGDPQRFLLPITQDESTGFDGYAAIGSGIALNNAVDGSSVFRDLSDLSQEYGVPGLYTVNVPDPACSYLLLNVDFLNNFDSKIGLGGFASRNESENTVNCFVGRGIAIGGRGLLDLLARTDYARLPFFEISAIPAPVPEPGTLPLLAVPLSVVGLVLARWRRYAA